MKALPAAYAWLDRVQDMPRTIAYARELYGTLEAGGAANSPTIIAWAKEVGGNVAAVYKADAIPWCGLFAAVVCQRAGKALPKDPLWALNWGTFGNHVTTPALGDVLVFVRTDSAGHKAGHVGFYVGEDEGAYHVLAGNQGDAVTIARIAKDRLYTARRPAYTQQPAGVQRHTLQASGALSQNEA